MADSDFRADLNLGPQWLRFSLRALLLWTVLTSLFLAWIGRALIRARHQRNAAAKLQSPGGYLGYEDELAGWAPPAPKVIRFFLGDDAFTRGVQLPTGRREGWLILPSLKMWAASSAFWISLGVVGVLGASARPRDH